MARKSMAELRAQAIASLPDNVVEEITPADVRNMILDFINAIAPAYGVLRRSTPNVQTLGLTDSLVIFDVAQDSDPSQTTSAVPASTIARAERGTSTINFTMDVEAPVNRFITFTLYKNGAATPWRITCNGGGAGNPVSVALTAVDYADPAATYDVRATAEVAGVSTTLNNGAFILSVDPVNSYA